MFSLTVLTHVGVCNKLDWAQDHTSQDLILYEEDSSWKE